MHLKIGYRPWAGSSQVPLEDSSIAAIAWYEVDDILVPYDCANFDLDGFLILTITKGIYSEEWWRSLRARFIDPTIYLQGTDKDHLVLPISSAEFVEVDSLPPLSYFIEATS